MFVKVFFLTDKKSVSASLSPDLHKTQIVGNPDFRRAVAYDPEGLGTEARHHEKPLHEREFEAFFLPFLHVCHLLHHFLHFFELL